MKTAAREQSTLKVPWSGRAFDYSEEEIAAVVEVMRHGDPLTQGMHQARFEKEFAGYIGSPSAFAVTNCTNALDLAAILTGVGPGDEVIIPAHTFCASAIPFGRTGAKLLWADIDPKTWVISADSIKRLLSPRTKAIVAVHLYGLMADMEAIAAIGRQNAIHPRLADPLFPTALAAVIRRRCQPRQAGQLAAVLDLPPAEELAHQQPRRVRADPPQSQQLTYLLHLGGRPGRRCASSAPIPKRGSDARPVVYARTPASVSVAVQTAPPSRPADGVARAVRRSQR